MAGFSCAILVWVHIKDIKLSVHLPLGVNQFEPSRCADPNGFPEKNFTLLRNTHGFLIVLVPQHKKKHPKPPKSQQKNQQPSKTKTPPGNRHGFFCVANRQLLFSEHLHSSPCVCPHIQADHLHRSSDGWSVVRNLLETHGKITYKNPRNRTFEARNDAMFEAGDTCSKAHHFLAIYVSFRGCTPLSSLT